MIPMEMMGMIGMVMLVVWWKYPLVMSHVNPGTSNH